MRLYTTDIRYNSEIINLGAMKWLRYIENPTIVRQIIMRLTCNWYILTRHQLIVVVVGLNLSSWLIASHHEAAQEITV